MSIDKADTTGTQRRKKRVEQNDPNGAVLKSVKPNMLCGAMHQISIWQPTVIIDCHMHIQSGHCAPLQFVQDQGPLALVQSGLGFSRDLIENSGIIVGGLFTALEWIAKPVTLAVNAFNDKTNNPQEGFFTKNPVLDLVDMQSKPTDAIADLFINERNNVVENYFQPHPSYEGAPHLFFSSVVMTMDMEYCHLDGYFGVRVHNPLYEEGKKVDVTQPFRYWTPVHGKWAGIDTSAYRAESLTMIYVKSRNKTVYKKIDAPGKVTLTQSPDDFYALKKQAEKTGVILGNCFDPQTGKRRQVSIECAPVLMSTAETRKYENWHKQLKLTEEAVLKYPLKFLPLFHYDPRRWQEHGNAEPFSKVTGQGLHMGFKMYTAQGYRPWDVRRLPILKEFYGKCCLTGIPIMNHCTPQGAAAFERDEYYGFEHPFDDAHEEKELRSNCDKSDFFAENFVSPEAWKLVLDGSVDLESEQVCVSLSDLRLCLAHFGGPTPMGRKWNKQIIDMITSKKYWNLYTDISSSFADDNFRDHFKKIMQSSDGEHIKNHILFGTDWYLTFSYGTFNGKNLWDYCTQTKKFLDDFDTSLWPHFTQFNPYQFYRLDSEVPRIAENIIKLRQKDKNNLKVLGPSYDTKSDEILKEAAWIKVANKSHIIYEETP